MTDYGRGAVLGAATSLPMTSAAGVFLADRAHPVIVMGLLITITISLIVLMGSITRFVINTRREK